MACYLLISFVVQEDMNTQKEIVMGYLLDKKTLFLFLVA